MDFKKLGWNNHHFPTRRSTDFFCYFSVWTDEEFGFNEGYLLFQVYWLWSSLPGTWKWSSRSSIHPINCKGTAEKRCLQYTWTHIQTDLVNMPMHLNELVSGFFFSSFEFGKAVFVSWVGGLLTMAGGTFLSCRRCSRSESPESRNSNLHLPSTNSKSNYV